MKIASVTPATLPSPLASQAAKQGGDFSPRKLYERRVTASLTEPTRCPLPSQSPRRKGPTVHASPLPSPSESSCDGFVPRSQLSAASQIPSRSESRHEGS